MPPSENSLPDNYATDIEPCLCDCTISQLRAISSAIQQKAYEMEDSLSKTVTVDDFTKKMKSSTQSIPTMSPHGTIDIGDDSPSMSGGNSGE